MSGSITAHMLRRILRYDAETGKLYWRRRTPDLFKDGYRTAEGNCANWNAHYAGREAFTALDGHGYLHGNIFHTRQKAHRVAYCLMTGVWPENIDHTDGDRTNNKWANIREVTPAQNNMNLAARSSNKSGHTGICWDRARSLWLVTAKGKHIGRYSSMDDAVAARSAANLAMGFHQNHGRQRHGIG